MDVENPTFGSIGFGPEDLFISWPKTAKQSVRKKFATAYGEALKEGAKFALLPERFSGFASNFTFDRELVLLLKELLESSGSRNIFYFSPIWPTNRLLAKRKKFFLHKTHN